MKIWNLSPCVLGALSASAVALALSPLLSQRAHAFGGLWSDSSSRVDQLAEGILFVDNPDATITAVIQLEYAGPASQFAWLVPVPGKPTVGVSSNMVFERLAAATAPAYWVSVGDDGTCMQPEYVEPETDAEGDPEFDPDYPDRQPGPVVAYEQGSVGPYEYVNVAVDPAAGDPARAATDWLMANGYDLTGVDSKVLTPYLSQGLHLLAFKLAKGAGAGAIRPVILTYESKLPVIPIRPAAVAAKADMRLNVWVFGPSQAVPQNYKSLVLNEASIDWLTAQTFLGSTLPSGGGGPYGTTVSKPVNYDALVTAAANEAGGQGFVTELAGPASQFRDKVWSPLDEETFATMAAEPYADGIDALSMAQAEYGGWDGWNEAVQGATTLPADLTLAAFLADAQRYRGMVAVDAPKLFALLEEKVLRPVGDTAALLYQAPYLTRLFTTLSADEMTVDPIFDYNFDLTQISNVHVAKKVTPCDQDETSWRLETPQGSVVAGTGSTWPVAPGSLPANLKVVTLSSSGSGTVVTDNSEAIASELFGAAGELDGATAMPRSPQTGLAIGGSQRVTPNGQFEPTTDDAAKGAADSGRCSLSGAGAGTGGSLVCWFPLVALWLTWRRRRSRRPALTYVGLAGLLLVGCGGEKKPAAPAQEKADAATVSVLPGALTPEQLRDPTSCKGCHPAHYREWSSSMHAYAAQDPVFLAMNRRGQRETNGELGDFCVKCHAPMAVEDKLTTDGLNLEQLPDLQRGVSCYFCHNATSIEGDHNGKIGLANDSIMRGSIQDPVLSPAHRAEYSDMFDTISPRSSALCGGCHDVVTPSGVHLERTLQEYRHGIFSKSARGEAEPFDSCVGCHMPGQQGQAAVEPPGAPERIVHEHLWPGVDLPLTNFPNSAAMRSAVEDCQLGKSVPFFTLEVTAPDVFTFQIETGAGHNQPSGAAQDRRMWLEFLAYDESGALLEQVSSGNIADGQLEEVPEGDPAHDPHLLMFRDRIYNAQGKPVHMFWEAEKSKAHPDGYESQVLPVATTTYVAGKNAVVKQYRARGPNGELPARVTARLRMRPIGIDVLQDLVKSGDLDPAVIAKMPTLTFGAQIEWTRADGLMKTVTANVTADCNKYRCMLDPSSQDCR
jgi:hypothetical protein